MIRLRLPRGLLIWAVLASVLSPPSLADDYLTLYRGKYSDNKLAHTLLSKPISYWDSYLNVIALGRGFEFESPLHQWELEAQLGKHQRGQDHWEFNLVAIYRINRFPWHRYLRTTAALGEGLSYADEVPPLEAASTTNVGATRLLNYILFETTFAPPQVEDWSLVVRVHHRSGVFGLFNDVEGGSNIIAAGIKLRY